MAYVLGGMFNLAQAALGGYALQFSISSIQKLHKYEDMTQRAAKYSSKVAKDLDKIRTTQAAGAIALVVSLLSSLYAAHTAFNHPSDKTTDLGLPRPLVLAAFNAVAAVFAQRHIASFWDARPKVPLPGLGDHNEAVSNTLRVKQMLEFLAASWVLSAVWETGTWFSEAMTAVQRSTVSQ